MHAFAISLWEQLAVNAKSGKLSASFRGDAKHRTTMCYCTSENLEIPGLRFAHPGMTTGIEEDLRMRILQPAEWSKPRGFSHGVEIDGPGKWIVLAGQTGGDEKGDYAPDMAAQVGMALKRIVKLLGEAGAGPEHIVRLTWYLTSRSEYEAAGPGIGAGWKETLGRNFPPSTLLYIDGLVDVRAKVEIEVTAFVPKA
jgi:enamine deaminase RidA (YjgF/YER057c/UK114 family)